MALYNGKVTRKMAVNNVSVIAWNDETEVAEKTSVKIIGRLNEKKLEKAVKEKLAKNGFSLCKITEVKTTFALMGCTIDYYLAGAEVIKEISPDEVEEEDVNNG